MNSNSNNKLIPYVKNKSVQKGIFYLEDKVPALFLILQGIVLGIAQLIMAIRAFFFRITGGIFADISIPWFRVFIIGLAAYILTQKNININFNLNAPQETVVTPVSDTQTLSVLSTSVNTPPAKINLQELEETAVRNYIRRFEHVAKAEMEKFNIPASVKMAQGILESQGGQLTLSTQLNNHFNIKCETAQSKNCVDTNIGQLKKYTSAWEGWRAHSQLITSKITLQTQDYKTWAQQLQKNGYNQDKLYAQKLIQIIEQYNLTRLDK